MHPDAKRLVAVLVILALAGAGYWYYRGQATPPPSELAASGTVEATEYAVAPEVAGLVQSVAVAEGDVVTAGQALVKLDDTLARTQRQQTEAAFRAASSSAAAAAANLALLKAGPMTEQVIVSRTVVDKARLAVDQLQESYDALTATLRALPPGQSLKQQLDQAKASLANAEAQHDLVRAGANPKQVEAAKAQAEAAQAQAEAAKAALDVADVQIGRFTLHAPAGGTVLSRAVEPGTVVLPGATLLVIADLAKLAITVYVPEDRYGEISLGQDASVRVDSFPDRHFAAKVTHIADQAEFTPRNVQTAEGRKSTVFAVKLAIENPDDKLKPGMPADVTFED